MAVKTGNVVYADRRRHAFRRRNYSGGVFVELPMPDIIDIVGIINSYYLISHNIKCI